MKPCRKHDGLALSRAIGWLIDDGMFASLIRHGNTNWTFVPLVTMALCWAWGGEAGLQERFRSGLNILTRLFPRCEWGQTYQGFLKILHTWSDRLRMIVKTRLRERMQHLVDPVNRIHGWIVMAVDGTRVAAPRTDANLNYFNRPVRHRKKTRRKISAARRPQRQPATPQVWLTVVWHVGLGLLWDWRQGPTGSSERGHLREMIPELPAGSLLVADAGFQGYEYWKSLLDQGHSFVIRVAGQVRLLRGLGWARQYENMVYLWPERACQRRDPPLALRLWEFHDGRQSWWLVTNVLETQRLPARAIQEIYRRRWGVEIFLRGFKQTFGRDHLRSHSPQNVQLELDWSLLGLWSLELLGVRELISCGQSPHALSTAGVLRAIRQTLQAASLGCDLALFSRLAAIKHDGYRRRQKAIRDWPRKRAADTIKGPVISYASFQQFQAAQELSPHAA